MFFVQAELQMLLGKLEAEEVPYALCGALALAIYGFPRATLDIDLLALRGSSPRIRECAKSVGFTLEAAPMSFAADRVKIQRTSKVVPGNEDVLMLDILSLAPEIEGQIEVATAVWQDFPIRVVTRASLIRLKKLRGSAQDHVDIGNLAS